jgi:hypothetical protein
MRYILAINPYLPSNLPNMAKYNYKMGIGLRRRTFFGSWNYKQKSSKFFHKNKIN